MTNYREIQPPGFEITHELRTWETRHVCPRCAAVLFAGEKRGICIEACGMCGGLWMNTETAKRVLAEGSRAPEELARKVESVTSRIVHDERVALRCPEGGEPLTRASLGVSTRCVTAIAAERRTARSLADCRGWPLTRPRTDRGRVAR